MAKVPVKNKPSISEQAQTKMAEQKTNLPSVDVKSRLPQPGSLTEIDSRQWRVLVETTFPNARSPESVMMAFDYCKARGLDIFKKPVHIVPMWSSSLGREVETVWPGINEVQITAARTGAWAGMDEPKWGPDKTKTFKGRKKVKGDWLDATVEITFPEWCSVTVYRIVSGVRCPFTEPVYWMEAYSRSGGGELPTDMWAKRPHGQFHKVAKAAALRAAFPEEGEYTAEEMEGKVIDVGGVPIVEIERPRVPSPDATPEIVVESEPAPAKTAPKPPAAPKADKPAPKTPEKAASEPKALRLTPHTLTPDDNSKTFPSWAARYIEAISHSTSDEELAAWREKNSELLQRLRKNVENYERVESAEAAMADNLGRAAKVETPSPTPAQSTIVAGDEMPSPADDPEAALNWIKEHIIAFTDYEEAQAWFEENVAPRTEDFFPPDFSEATSYLRRLEEKLAP